MDTFQRLILSALFVFTAPAFAQPTIDYFDMSTGRTGTAINYGGGQVHIWPDAGDRRQISNGANGSVILRDRVPVNTSRGVITVTARSSINAASIARGAAIAGRALPAAGIAIGVGSVLWDLLEDNRIKPNGSGGMFQDPGVSKGDLPTYCWGQIECSPTANAAAAVHVAQLNANAPPFYSYTLQSVTVTGPDTATFVYAQSVSGVITIVNAGMNRFLRNVNRCPDSPASTGVVGSDGKCGTGQFTKPLTEQDVIDIIARDVTDKKDKAPLVNDILSTPGGAVDITPDSVITSGPSSQSGSPPAPLTVNTPSGPVTTTESPGIAIRYRGREVEWEPDQIITTRPGPNPGDPDEVTTTDAPDLPSADPQTSQTPDYCLSNPDRAGCSKLGTVDAPPWAPTEKPIELKAQSPWGSDSAQCPAPRIVTVGGRQFSWDWKLVCDFFRGVRFAVIASAWIAAVLIFLGSRTEA